MGHDRSDALRASGLALLRVVITFADRARGVSSLSDDDFARAVIAERFAAHPSLDPSGTSWLPAPFWLVGGVLRATSGGLEVIRATHGALSAAAIALIYLGARDFGLSQRAAWLAGLLAAVIQPAHLLGSVPVPELPVAALGAFAALSLARRDEVGAARAALAVLAASLSRYEAWPIATVVAACVLGDRLPVARRLGWAAVALAGPAAWIAWNAHAHGDALHFLARVTAYRRAIDGGAPPLAALGAWLRALAANAPVLLVPLTALSMLAADVPPSSLARWKRPGVVILAQVAFVGVGEVVGGAPTHHPERALLVVWLLVAVAWADLAFGALVRVRSAAVRAALALAMLGVMLVDARTGRRTSAEVAGRRADELGIGAALRARAKPGERALVVTEDYGAEAIVAAFGRPLDATIDVTRADPRRDARPDPLASDEALRAATSAADATWVVAAGSPAPLASLTPAARVGTLSAWRVR